MTSTIKVRSNRGFFNLCDRSHESINVTAHVPALGEKPIWFNLNLDHGRELNSCERWSEYLAEMCEAFFKSVWISTARADVQRLAAWLEDEANCAAMDAAWAEQEIAAIDRQQAELDKRRQRAASVAASCAEALSAAA